MPRTDNAKLAHLLDPQCSSDDLGVRQWLGALLQRGQRAAGSLDHAVLGREPAHGLGVQKPDAGGRLHLRHGLRKESLP